jgi:hypothetical protein
MASVKHTISLPEDISADLTLNIPARERSGFIAHSLREALLARKRQELLSFLETLKPQAVDPNQESPSDYLVRFRATRARNVTSHE